MTPPDLHLTDRLDGFTSWEEVDDVLHDEWLGLLDGHGRQLVHVGEGLGLVEHPGSLSARERRGLHRGGFRLERAGELRVWLWALPDGPLPDDPLPDDRLPDERVPVDVVASLRRWQERSRLARRQALRTVRDVLRADVGEVAVVRLPDDDDLDEWEDDRDDSWDDSCDDGACCCAAPSRPCGA